MLTLSLFSFMDIVNGTNIPEQLQTRDLDIFFNPFFIIPYIGLVGWFIYKQDFRDIVILALLTFCWWVTGTEYMKTLVVGENLQIEKVLPVMFGGATILGIIIYLMFMKGD